MQNVNDIFFDGHYKDIWRSLIPEDLTIKETDFIFQYFRLKPGDKVLDLMCGYGRHTIALAQKGIEVTAVDNLGDYANEISSIAQKEGLPVHVEKSNVLDYKTNEAFDLVICMGNSLNFFDRAGTLQLLSIASSSLKKEGYLLINSWSIAEIAIKHFTAKTWGTISDFKYLVESKYLFHPSRIETDTLIIDKEGNTEEKKAIDYIFSIAEMERMLTETGFWVREIYSIPGRKVFALGDPRAYLVAEKK